MIGVMSEIDLIDQLITIKSATAIRLSVVYFGQEQMYLTMQLNFFLVFHLAFKISYNSSGKNEHFL